jgi:hypothetical protein
MTSPAPSPAWLVLEDVRITEFYLRHPQSRNFGLDQGQQLLAARVIALLQQERTVPFQLAELPPGSEFPKHLAVSGVGYAFKDTEPATFAWLRVVMPLRGTLKP